MTIFEYSDYRAFIKAFFAKFPKKGRGKLLELAESLRIHPTAVSQIFSGSRNFSDEQALEICEILGLTPLEEKYFRLLVRIESAGTQKLKKNLKAELDEVKRESTSLATRVKIDKAMTDTEKAIFYSSWLYSVCRLYCSTDESGRSLDEISSYVGISRAKTSVIMNFLLQTNLVVLEKEKYKMGAASTFVDRHSPFLPKHLSNWRMKSVQAIDSLTDEELMFSGPFSISRSDFAILRERLAGVIKDFSNLVKDSDPEEVACLNIDLIWAKK